MNPSLIQTKVLGKETVTCWEREGKGAISKIIQYSDLTLRSQSPIRALDLIEHMLTYATVCSATRILNLPAVQGPA